MAGILAQQQSSGSTGSVIGLILGLVIGLGVAFLVFNDAKKLEGRGIKIGSLPAAGWAVLSLLCFLLAGVYFFMRSQALAKTGPGAAAGIGQPIGQPYAAPAAPVQYAPAPQPPVGAAPSGACPQCGNFNASGARFCASCGRDLAVAPPVQMAPPAAPIANPAPAAYTPSAAPGFCSTCGSQLQPGKSFCSTCGSPAPGGPEAL